MGILYDDLLDVHYRFIFVSVDGAGCDLIESRRGQANGLLGTSVPHVLSMVTGLHTGSVPLLVEWHSARPEVDESWGDVVEGSFEVPQQELVLSAFETFVDIEVPVVGWHRARFSARRMDEGRAMDTPGEGQAAPDSYNLVLWPDEPAPDVIMKASSEAAAYWHAQTA